MNMATVESVGTKEERDIFRKEATECCRDLHLCGIVKTAVHMRQLWQTVGNHQPQRLLELGIVFEGLLAPVLTQQDPARRSTHPTCIHVGHFGPLLVFGNIRDQICGIPIHPAMKDAG